MVSRAMLQNLPPLMAQNFNMTVSLRYPTTLFGLNSLVFEWGRCRCPTRRLAILRWTVCAAWLGGAKVKAGEYGMRLTWSLSGHRKK
jgi:hypothetical protein